MSDNRIRNFVIVGGGTAGWMAAAALSRVAGTQTNSITLVESEEIGTVGVGEATIPPILHYNHILGIDEDEFVRETNATFKLGIEFVNWRKLGHTYFHQFGLFGAKIHNGAPFIQYWLRWLRSGGDPDYQLFNSEALAARENKFGRIPPNERGELPNINYAFQFDAATYAAYLRRYSERRGVVRTEGRVVNVRQNGETGFIEAVELNDGRVVSGDFFIDCSGFRGLLIEGTYQAGFEDWSQWLPNSRAAAVPSERIEDPTPFTRSTARESGWQWRIPLQHRTGNGYVFSSQFIGEDEAAAELLANLDTPALDEPRLLRFQAGRRTESWKSNCVALGLASGFLEPLESTSIYLIQIAIMHLLPLFPDGRIDPKAAAEFNRKMDVEYDRIRDFLILHYHLTKREETEIWKYCRHMDVPDSLRAKMALFEHRGHIEQYRDGLFTPPSWLSVYVGQGLQPKHFHPRVAALPLERLVEQLTTLRDDIQDRVDEMPSHAAFLERYCPADGPLLRAEAAPVVS
jgi:tryptophan halogenase